MVLPALRLLVVSRATLGYAGESPGVPGVRWPEVLREAQRVDRLPVVRVRVRVAGSECGEGARD